MTEEKFCCPWVLVNKIDGIDECIINNYINTVQQVYSYFYVQEKFAYSRLCGFRFHNLVILGGQYDALTKFWKEKNNAKSSYPCKDDWIQGWTEK